MPSLVVRTDNFIQSELYKLFPLINVDRVKEIPVDYPGPMAVPITFMDKYNPKEFQVLGITDSKYHLETDRKPYRRIIIRHLQLPYEFVNILEWLEITGVTADVQIIEEE